MSATMTARLTNGLTKALANVLGAREAEYFARWFVERYKHRDFNVDAVANEVDDVIFRANGEPTVYEISPYDSVSGAPETYSLEGRAEPETDA